MQTINSIVTSKELKSSLSPAYVFPDVRVEYPVIVIQALGELYDECNRSFYSLIEKNREWSTDYRFCFKNGIPVNTIIQIDMCGLSEEALKQIASMNLFEVKEFLRARIFEMENNWAVYQLLRSVLESENEISFYKKQTMLMLDSLRKEYGMPIALLAVTKEKYISMKATEFGKEPNEPLLESEVYDLSGFDYFFGPDDFKKHLEENENQCKYLLYVRASDPIEKLKKPELIVEQPLLSDFNLRKIIKEYSITFNIDNPNWNTQDICRINDTKWYMPDMNMGFPIYSYEDLFSEEFLFFLNKKGVKTDFYLSGNLVLRVKPAQGTFGCYGHIRGSINDGKFRYKVKKGLQERGVHFVQIEQEVPLVLNLFEDGMKYAYIDRVFYGQINGVSSWMGGHREFLPFESQEVKSGRLHGNSATVSAEIK